MWEIRKCWNGIGTDAFENASVRIRDVLRTQQGYGIKNPRRQKSKRAINTDSALKKAQSKKKEAAGLKIFFLQLKFGLTKN